MESLLDKISSYPANAKIIEVASSSGFNKKTEKWERMYFRIDVIFEEPSADDSRFHPVILIAQKQYSKTELADLLEKVDTIAQALNLEVYNPDEIEGYIPPWIQTQTKEEITWTVSWESLEWENDATRVLKQGVEVVSATCGSFANGQVSQQLCKELSPPYQAKIQVDALSSYPDYKQFAFSAHGDFPENGITIHGIRTLALADVDYKTLFQRIQSAAPRWSAKDVLVALCYSFEIAMDDAESFLSLEATDLSKLVNPQKWLQKFDMRTAYNSGLKPSEFLDPSGGVQVAMDFVTEFQLEKSSGKSISHYLCYSKDLEKIDSAFFDEMNARKNQA